MGAFHGYVSLLQGRLFIYCSRAFLGGSKCRFIEGFVAKVTIFRDAFESFDLVRTHTASFLLAHCGDALILVLGAGERVFGWDVDDMPFRLMCHRRR